MEDDEIITTKIAPENAAQRVIEMGIGYEKKKNDDQNIYEDLAKDITSFIGLVIDNIIPETRQVITCAREQYQDSLDSQLGRSFFRGSYSLGGQYKKNAQVGLYVQVVRDGSWSGKTKDLWIGATPFPFNDKVVANDIRDKEDGFGGEDGIKFDLRPRRLWDENKRLERFVDMSKSSLGPEAQAIQDLIFQYRHKKYLEREERFEIIEKEMMEKYGRPKKE